MGQKKFTCWKWAFWVVLLLLVSLRLLLLDFVHISCVVRFFQPETSMNESTCHNGDWHMCFCYWIVLWYGVKNFYIIFNVITEWKNKLYSIIWKETINNRNNSIKGSIVYDLQNKLNKSFLKKQKKRSKNVKKTTE